MIKLIASDLDGTIINSKNECDPSTVAEIRRLRNLGVRFAVCSGRPVDSTLDSLQTWGLAGVTDYMIGCNGGEVRDFATGKTVVSYPLEPEVVKHLIDLYEPLGCIPTLYEKTTLYVQHIDPFAEAIANRVGVKLIETDIRSRITTPQVKVMFLVKEDQMATLEAFAANHPDSRYIVFKTAKDLLEAAHPLLAKDVGLRIIGSMTHILPSEMMAFGDTTNDIRMLEYVRYGICMENGTEDAKRVAYAIAPSVSENGFARYLQAHLKTPQVQ